MDRTSATGYVTNAAGQRQYADLVPGQTPGTSVVAFDRTAIQEVCFDDSDHCVEYDGSKLVYSVGNARLFSVDNNGNMTIAGTLSQSGSP